MKLYRAGVAEARSLHPARRECAQARRGDRRHPLSSSPANRQPGAEAVCLQFMDDYGMHDLRALAAVVHNRAEAAIRDAIRAMPDGVYRSEIENNPLGDAPALSADGHHRRRRHRTGLRRRAAATAAGRPELHVSTMPPRTPDLSAEMRRCSRRCAATPTCYRPFTVKAPAGSILNADKPVSVNLRTRTGWYIAPNIFRATLAEAAPGRVRRRRSGLPHSISIYARDGEGRCLHRSFLHGRRPGRLFAHRR